MLRVSDYSAAVSRAKVSMLLRYILLSVVLYDYWSSSQYFEAFSAGMDI